MADEKTADELAAEVWPDENRMEAAEPVPLSFDDAKAILEVDEK